MRDERAPQRNREQHAQDAAADADEERLPERKPGPPSNDDEARQYEDDRRERAGVPDATVCTMLFSIDESLTALKIAIEMTAAGIDEAKVRPTFRPRYTLAAVKTVVMSAPRTSPELSVPWVATRELLQSAMGRVLPDRDVRRTS